MSRFPSRISVPAIALFVTGCMYQQPMYQNGPYGQNMYGQPMYNSQGGYVQPGTIVVPPSNSAPQPLGGSTYDPKDDFKAEDSRTNNDGRFYGDDEGAPLPKDPPSSSGSDSLKTFP